MVKPKIFIIPGNGDARIDRDNWYAWVRDALRVGDMRFLPKTCQIPCSPARLVWLPYIEQVTQNDPSVILIGHSSGAVAILRYLEHHRASGAIIVGANHTDMGYVEEKMSGYYDAPWTGRKSKHMWDGLLSFAQLMIRLLKSKNPVSSTKSYLPIITS